MLENIPLSYIVDDRRKISISEKISDANLIGCPFQIRIGKKSTGENDIELLTRRTLHSRIVSFDNLAHYLI